MEILCINDQNRPNEIPTSRWISLGESYTIRKLVLMKQQHGIAGIKLNEINNDDLFPYTYFRLDRFAISSDQIKELVEADLVEHVN